jgi:hypothetical protein
LICRRERPHPGAQLSFTDHDGRRFLCFITDQINGDHAFMEADHRRHAQVEDRVKALKATGGDMFPFHDFAANKTRSRKPGHGAVRSSGHRRLAELARAG